MTALRYGVSDTLVLVKRSLLRIPRQPDLLVGFTVQPILFVLLFVYVFGGASAAGWERSILTYNTTSNSWSAKAPMPKTRYAFDCVTVGDAAYLVGGFLYSPPGIFDTVERYDPFVETWSSPTRLQTPP